MTKIPSLKRARLLAHMTQASAASELGVSQSTYQRWETGTLKIPDKKVAQIAKLFGTSNAAVLGMPPPFDLFGVDDSVADDRKYYGEVAIHFQSGGAPLLLPISEAVHSQLYTCLQQDEPFVRIEGLDNRLVFVRRAAISDLYFSSEAYDDYGPETDSYDAVLGIFPDDDFWRIAECFDDLSEVEDEFDPEILADAKSKLTLTDTELDALITGGSVKSEDRQKVRSEVAERTEKIIAHACNMTWQMGHCRREVTAPDAKLLFERFAWLDDDQDADGYPIILATDGYDRTIFIQPTALDYICMPAHKFREGEIQEAELELKDT